MAGKGGAAQAKRLGKTLVVAGLLGVPVAAHLAVVTHRGAEIAGWLVAVQVALVTWVSMSLGSSGRWPLARVAMTATATALTVMIWRNAGDGLMLAAAVPQAITYLGLLALFAASLAKGHEPIVTMVARRARGALSETLRHYTRQVTMVWCGFFASQILISLLLWLLAPLAWWSAFVNLASLPMVSLMFAAELTWRHVHHGIHRPPASGRWGQARQVLAQIRSPVRQAEP